jgi:hypothetical protein
MDIRTQLFSVFRRRYSVTNSKTSVTFSVLNLLRVQAGTPYGARDTYIKRRP